jgi:hypothetical protein
VAGECVDLGEGSLVEQSVDPLAGGEAPFPVDGGDGGLAGGAAVSASRERRSSSFPAVVERSGEVDGAELAVMGNSLRAFGSRNDYGLVWSA